jgi:AraC family transcriptional regulator
VLGPVDAETINKYMTRLLPVLVHCEEHLDEQLDLVDLASIAGYSPYHFHRIFRQVTGETPKAYLRRLRLERAVYRLKVSPDNVLEIALEAGFATNETFTRAFTRRFGMHPSTFRAVLREYRDTAFEAISNHSISGYSAETPLTLRFDMRKESVLVQETPARHLLFVRHQGYENLPVDQHQFLALWDELFAYADEHDIEYSPELLVGVTHDDPYVTDEPKIRFDACLPVKGKIDVSYPIGYRRQQSGLCVTRRHRGGAEEIAKSFALIGVAWMPSEDHGLGSTPPFEVYHCAFSPDGLLRQDFTEACVPLERNHRQGESCTDSN